MTEEMTEIEVEELHEQYLQSVLKRAEDLVAEFTNEAEDLLDAVRGTEYEAYDCFDELTVALESMSGNWFRWHTGHPTESGEYLALSIYGTWYTIRWSERHGCWNAFDEDETGEHGIAATEFAGWLNLPDVKRFIP